MLYCTRLKFAVRKGSVTVKRKLKIKRALTWFSPSLSYETSGKTLVFLEPQFPYLKMKSLDSIIHHFDFVVLMVWFYSDFCFTTQ